MKKIGVITKYYRIYNLGASLQAYALNKTIRDMGYYCETLTYKTPTLSLSSKKKVLNKIKRYGLNSAKMIPKIIRRVADNRKTKEVKKAQIMRYNNFNNFCETAIPHSLKIFDRYNIADAVNDYDVFITGSDQVWTLDNHSPNPDLFLEFVPESKSKLSYAAGMCKSSFDEYDKDYLRKVLSSYQGIAVREENTRQMMAPIVSSIGKEVIRTIDPTLLIKGDEWIELLPERIINEDYIFVYLLVPSKSRHEIIENYAKKVKKKVVALVNINGRYEPLDKNFGDIQVNDCGPLQLINYVKYASKVFTDSFHGFSFCLNFSKDFFVFLKTGDQLTLARNNRIQTLIDLTNLKDRVISEDVSTETLLNKSEIDYSSVQKILQSERERSIKWLETQLSNSKETEHKNIAYIADSSHCTGCGACKAICPKECINMVNDKEGFRRPQVNSDKCINCKKCINTCPIVSAPQLNDNTNAFFVKTKNESDLMNSTSGGAFSLIAKKILSKGGAIYGAAFDSNMNVVHTKVTDANDLKKIMRSKYVQSNIEKCFASVKQDLDSGKIVLFSGTPCQIAGIKKYLSKDYTNLYLIDIICHGVPSPKVWKKYIKEVEKQYNDKVIDVLFRDKKYGYSTPYFTFLFKSGNVITMPLSENLFYRGFALDIFNRQSCHECSFKGLDRCSDMTIADFHGIKNVIKDYIDDDKGVSLVISHSEKGVSLLNSIDDYSDFVVVDKRKAIERNGMCVKSAVASKDRKMFFEKNVNVIEFFKRHYKKVLFINAVKRTMIGKELYRIVKR